MPVPMDIDIGLPAIMLACIVANTSALTASETFGFRPRFLVLFNSPCLYFQSVLTQRRIVGGDSFDANPAWLQL